MSGWGEAVRSRQGATSDQWWRVGDGCVNERACVGTRVERYNLIPMQSVRLLFELFVDAKSNEERMERITKHNGVGGGLETRERGGQ